MHKFKNTPSPVFRFFSAALIAFSFTLGTREGIAQTGATDTIHIQGGTLAPQNPLLKFTSDFMKLNEKYAVVGIQNGYTIYRNSAGGYFTIDPATGAMRSIT